jgi:hypothetical protein
MIVSLQFAKVLAILIRLVWVFRFSALLQGVKGMISQHCTGVREFQGKVFNCYELKSRMMIYDEQEKS